MLFQEPTLRGRAKSRTSTHDHHPAAGGGAGDGATAGGFNNATDAPPSFFCADLVVATDVNVAGGNGGLLLFRTQR